MRRLTRRVWIRIFLGLPLAAAGWFCRPSSAPSGESSGVDLDDLQEQLEFGLSPRTPL